MAELMRELFGVELATGSVDAIVQRAGEALAEPHALLAEQIRSAAVVNIDETGWRTAGGRRTLWGALSAQTAVFRIAAGRHQCEVTALLGEEFAGIACSDRWRAYDYLDQVPPSVRQQPARALAGPVDVHPRRRRRTDQQPRRARPSRGRHLPQALARQPIRAGRAHDRATALLLRHLPSAAALTFAYLTDVLTASIRGDPIPLLA
jgi:hypothetical protein